MLTQRRRTGTSEEKEEEEEENVVWTDDMGGANKHSWGKGDEG